jgi:hypothetical protein
MKSATDATLRHPAPTRRLLLPGADPPPAALEMAPHRPLSGLCPTLASASRPPEPAAALTEFMLFRFEFMLFRFELSFEFKLFRFELI